MWISTIGIVAVLFVVFFAGFMIGERWKTMFKPKFEEYTMFNSEVIVIDNEYVEVNSLGTLFEKPCKEPEKLHEYSI